MLNADFLVSDVWISAFNPWFLMRDGLPTNPAKRKDKQTARLSAGSSSNEAVSLRLIATFCGFSYRKGNHSTQQHQAMKERTEQTTESQKLQEKT